MAKKKFLLRGEYLRNIKPKEELSFGVKLPFKQITSPSGTIFAAWHGPSRINPDSTGTAYYLRLDNDDPMPLNIDVYSMRPTKEPNVIEIEAAPKQTYHWGQDIPQFIKTSTPKKFIDKTNKILSKR